MITKHELDEALRGTGYIADQKTLDAIWVALLGKRPLIMEGPAGCGKTSVSRALAQDFKNVAENSPVLVREMNRLLLSSEARKIPVRLQKHLS